MTTPWQMRRQARRMRRYGLQPMIVINGGGQLPDIVIVLLFRWAWRYRSELAPLLLATITLLVGVIVHLTHPGAWLVIAAATAVAAAILLVTGRRIGLATRAERLYTAAGRRLARGGHCPRPAAPPPPGDPRDQRAGARRAVVGAPPATRQGAGGADSGCVA